MKSDCVLNDDELEEKRQVIIKNRIKRMKRKRFYCLITKCNCPTVTRSNQMHCRGNHDTTTQPISGGPIMPAISVKPGTIYACNLEHLESDRFGSKSHLKKFEIAGIYGPYYSQNCNHNWSSPILVHVVKYCRIGCKNLNAGLSARLHNLCDINNDGES